MDSKENQTLAFPGKKQDSDSSETIRVPSKHYKAHYSDSSCVLCGTQYIKKGRVLHGHCVCEDCVEYILSGDNAQSGEEADQNGQAPLPDAN